MSETYEKNTVLQTLQKHLETPIVRQIVEELNKAASKKEEQKEEKPPAEKKQFVIVVSDPEGLIKTDLTGWVVQIPESESTNTTLERIGRGAFEFNNSKKGRLNPVKSLGEAIESVGSKFYKDSSIWIKTKTPVIVVCTDNTLPDVGDHSE